MKNLTKSSIILLLFYLFIISAAFSQEPETGEETINIDTLLLSVPVIVGDRDGRYISGLKKENFYIVENGIKRPVDFFADDSAPMHVAILVDTSSSTKKILDDIKDAARDFVRILRPEDRALIASFDSKTIIWSNFTSDQEKLIKAIDKMKSEGVSRMYDALYLLLQKHFGSFQGRKAIIVLTDGGVDGFMVSENKLLKALNESDVMIYPLLFDLPSTNFTTSNSDIQNFREFQISEMGKFSTITGGKVFHSGMNDLKVSFRQIADELKKQYTVGFYPIETDVDKTFKIGLMLDPKLFDLQNIVLRSKRVINFKTRFQQKKTKS